MALTGVLDTSLAKIIADRQVGDIAQRLAVRGLKLRKGLEAGPAENDIGFGATDISGAFPLRGDGFRTTLLSPKSYDEQPELFFGPFMQLGTYLGIGPPIVQFAIDMITDVPGNLITIGTGGILGLTKAGKFSRLITTLASESAARVGAKQVGKAVTADVILKEIEAALTFAGKHIASGSVDDLTRAAKAGNRTFKGYVTDVLARDGIDPSIGRVLAAMKKDRSALALILENSEKFKAIGELKGGAFLQTSLRARVASGQVRGLINVATPFVTDPETGRRVFSATRFMRQMVWFTYKTDTHIFPGTRLLSEGLDRVAKGKLMSGKTLPLADNVNLDVALKLVDKSRAAQARQMRTLFKKGGFKSGDGKLQDFAFPTQTLKVLAGMPNDRALAELGIEATDEQLRALYNLVEGSRAPTTGRKMDFDDFKLDWTANQLKTRKALDRSITARRDAVLAKGMAGVDNAAEVQALLGQQIDVALQESSKAQLRLIADDFSLESLRGDSYSWGNGLGARGTMGTLMAKTAGEAARSIVRRGSGTRASADIMQEVLPRLLDSPKAWRFDDTGRAFLRSEAELEAIAPELSDLTGNFLKRTLDENPGIDLLLRHDGVDPEIVELSKMMRDTLDTVGSNLVDEGVLKRLYEEYFPRIFDASPKFFKEFKGSKNAPNLFAEKVFSEATDSDVLKSMLKVTKSKINKSRAGKLSLEEARRWVEATAVEMERRGFGKYKRDGVTIFAGYMDAANRAVLMGRLFRDLPRTSPRLTRGFLEDYLVRTGKLKDLSRITDSQLKVARRIMETKPKGKLLDFYVETGLRPRASTKEDLLEGRLFPNRKELVRAKARRARQIARQAVAKELAGETTVGRVFVNSSNPVELQAKWILDDAIPASIQNGAAVKRAINKRIASRAKKGDVLKKVAAEAEKAGIGKAAAGAAKAKTLWVFKPDFAQLQDVFRLYDKEGMSKGWLRMYDRLNYNLKATVLLGDIYHLNVLATSQFVARPQDILASLRDDAGNLLEGVREGAWGKVRSASVLGGAAGGAVAGAAAGVGFDADAEGIGGFSFAGAVYGAMIGAAMRNAKIGTQIAFNPENMETIRWMGLGQWAGRPDDRAIGAVQRGLGLLTDQAENAGADILVSPLTGAKHVIDAWDETLWGLVHNGSKQFYFHVNWQAERQVLRSSEEYGERAIRTTFETLKRAGPEGDKAALIFRGNGRPLPFDDFLQAERFRMDKSLATEIVQTSNSIFGGQNFRFLLENPDWQRIMRRFLLAPDWTLSRLNFASSMLLNMKTPERAAMGAVLGTAAEYAGAGFDPNEVEGNGIPTRGIGFGALFGVLGGRWAQKTVQRMGTKGDFMAKEARRMTSAALAAGFTFSALLNHAFTGHWIWENEPGKRLSIQLPGTNDRNRAQFITLGKPWKEAFEFASVLDAEKFPIPAISRLRSKASVPLSAGLTIYDNRNIFGPVAMGDDSALEVGYAVSEVLLDTVTPIIVQGPLRLAGKALGGSIGARDVPFAGVRFAGFPTSTGRESLTDPSALLNIQPVQIPRPAARVPVSSRGL